MVITCSQCDLFGMCQSLGLNTPNNDGLKFKCVSQIELNSGEVLFNSTDSDHKIYAVRKGMLSSLNPNNHQIESLFLPGELVGLEATVNCRYTNDVVANNIDCSLCVLDLDNVDTNEISFQKEISLALRNKLVQQQKSVINCINTAEQRFSAFLLDVLERRKKHYFFEQHFYLPISQEELANYLGLAVATLNRAIKKLRSMKVISLDKRFYTIHDVSQLESIVKT